MLAIDWFGTVPYQQGLELQAKAVEARRTGAAGDRLLLLEHPPVITLGRGADRANVRTPAAQLGARGIEVHRVSRGGDVTYHGPGQLVGYLVADLQSRGEPDVPVFLRRLEGALIEALGSLGVRGAAVPGLTGVFAEDGSGSAPLRKVASIGIGVRRWVTDHGFALNATVDLTGFDDIVPCGLHKVQMTSVARELGRAPSPLLFDAVRDAVAEAFGRHFA